MVNNINFDVCINILKVIQANEAELIADYNLQPDTVYLPDRYPDCNCIVCRDISDNDSSSDADNEGVQVYVQQQAPTTARQLKYLVKKIKCLIAKEYIGAHAWDITPVMNDKDGKSIRTLKFVV